MQTSFRRPRAASELTPPDLATIKGDFRDVKTGGILQHFKIIRSKVLSHVLFHLRLLCHWIEPVVTQA